jgi:DNA-directed RNA polymerase subunit alpha
LNPSLHLATLNAGASLALDITIERGRGYLSTDRDAESRIIGVIPIDAIFSPVRRVMFDVEPTRVAQSTNYDRLVLDIETDGSISPRESLASAAATLRSLVDLIATLSEEPQALELSEPIGANIGVPDLDLPIEDLDLSERPRNCLKRGQVNTIGELLLKIQEFKEHHNGNTTSRTTLRRQCISSAFADGEYGCITVCCRGHCHYRG